MIWLALWLACAPPDPADATYHTSLSPVEAAALADAIVASPADADRILSDAGLDRRRFEAELFRIAEDPEASQRYLSARRR